jgi:hypothetical protein
MNAAALTALPSTFTSTTASLHAIAEHVLAAARYAVDAHIRMRPAPNGVETPPFGERARVVGIDGDELFDRDDQGERRAAISTVRAAAEFYGVTPGVPAGLWTPTTSPDLDATLAVDLDSVTWLSRWYELAGSVLLELGRTGPVPLEPLTLWPEGFDLGTTGGRVYYGGSPGDAKIAQPYLYVAPFEKPAKPAPYWNAPFGAALTYDRIGSAAEALAFLVEGQQRAGGSRLA